MKISVIVPYHNEEAYLIDALTSLEEQEFKEFEVIIIASEAETPDEIIKTYSEGLNIKCYTAAKPGVAAARNEGLKNSTGKYVVYLDCDDYLDQGFLGTLYDLAEASQCDMVFGKLEYTWYKRNIFLGDATSLVKDDDDSSGEDDDSEEQPVQFNFLIEKGDSEEVIREKKLSSASRYLITKRKNMHSITVLGNMYLKSFLLDNNITFDEDQTYYCDMKFLCLVLTKAKNVDGIKEVRYIKRSHNDPIHLPSLLQCIGKDDFEFRTEAYLSTIAIMDKDCETRQRLDRKLIHYYSTDVAPAIRKNEEKSWRKTRMGAMKELIKGIDRDVIKHVSRYKRKLIKALLNDDLEKICKVSGRRNLWNWAVIIIKGPKRLKRIKDYLYKHRFTKQPMMDNVVMLESFFGKSYSDSPKYIFEKLNEMYPGKYEYVWILDKKKKLPYPAKQYKRFSLGYFKYLARSKYIVFNSRQPKYFIKRKGNIFLETWHGTPLKKLVFDIEEVVSAAPRYKRDFYIQSRSWDYLIAANQFSAEVFERAFVYDKAMLKFGYPRNDILHKENKDELAAKVRDRLGIPQDKKTILYAPTWRDDEYYESGKYKFSLQLDLKMMREKLGDDYVIILRTHYFIADNLDVSGMGDFIYNLSKYDDIAELYLISDLLITDYSSVFFDYANLKRPMLFYTYDLDKYRDVLRGFYIDMEKELPGPLLYTTEEVIDSIKNIDSVSEKYAKVYDEFYERFCGWEDGHAAENCIKEVFE